MPTSIKISILKSKGFNLGAEPPHAKVLLISPSPLPNWNFNSFPKFITLSGHHDGTVVAQFISSWQIRLQDRHHQTILHKTDIHLSLSQTPLLNNTSLRWTQILETHLSKANTALILSIHVLSVVSSMCMYIRFQVALRDKSWTNHTYVICSIPLNYCAFPINGVTLRSWATFFFLVLEILRRSRKGQGKIYDGVRSIPKNGRLQKLSEKANRKEEKKLVAAFNNL